MSYDQSMKHFHNHRKDRFTQQCNSYSRELKLKSCIASPEKFEVCSKESMKKILDNPPNFPFYIVQNSHIGVWEIVPKNHIASVEVKDYKNLVKFAFDYAELSI